MSIEEEVEEAVKKAEIKHPNKLGIQVPADLIQLMIKDAKVGETVYVSPENVIGFDEERRLYAEGYQLAYYEQSKSCTRTKMERMEEGFRVFVKKGQKFNSKRFSEGIPVVEVVRDS